jgi:hypothetical protein
MRALAGLGLAAILGGAVMAGGAAAQAAAKTGARKPTAGSKGKSKPAPKGKSAGPAKDPTGDAAPVPIPGTTVAVFPFTGVDSTPIRGQVMSVLRKNRIKSNTSLKPMFDSPEQFRETAAALGLVGYVDGDVEGDAGQASATIHLRSGATGLPIWSATYTGDRRQVPTDIAKRLWDEWSAALGKACADAAKPRKDREPMRINAGTPLADPPAGGN